MEILDKITNELKKQGKTQKELCEHIGLTQNNYTSWKSGQSESYKKYLPKIADFLNVSIDYLLGKEQKEKTATDGGLSEEDKAFMNLYRSLSEADKVAIQRIISGFLSSQE